MSERINTPFTNEHFVAFCEKMVGQPYWYGSVVYKCTENLRARKAKQYPAHYGSSRTARYRDDIAKKKVCADCVGLIKGYNWTNGGQGVIESIGTDRTFSSKYGGHGCPDKSANGMFSYCRPLRWLCADAEQTGNQHHGNWRTGQQHFSLSHQHRQRDLFRLVFHHQCA